MATERIGSKRDALRHADFRRLLAMRLVSQTADGFVQAALVASLAFSPEKATTASGFAVATAITIVPYSVIGPFAGVFIDRWSRRRIMVIAPLLRAAPVFLVLFSPHGQPVLFYAGALWVISVNRFFLSTAQAVVPRLVPTEDLLSANSVATVGGTVALLVGVFVGGLAHDAVGNGTIVTVAAVMWVVTSMIATRIRADLRPHVLPEATELLRRQLKRVTYEFADGIVHIVRTPRAIGPIVSISVDQVGQGFILVLALVVFRERFKEGVGSFSWSIGAGGVGVLLGLLTVGRLDRRYRREMIVAGSFVIGGVALLLISPFINRWSVLLASFVVGLSFAWKKVPVDTMVQEAVPDGLRGRVFSVYDVIYNLSRFGAALIAIPLLNRLSDGEAAALVGVVFIVYAPVLPLWLRHAQEAIHLIFYEGGRAEEWPRAVRWGDVEEPVEVVRSAAVERDGGRFRTFRLALRDGTVLDVSRDEAGGPWTVDHEAGDASV
jgi:MFS family permease